MEPALDSRLPRTTRAGDLYRPRDDGDWSNFQLMWCRLCGRIDGCEIRPSMAAGLSRPECTLDLDGQPFCEAFSPAVAL